MCRESIASTVVSKYIDKNLASQPGWAIAGDPKTKVRRFGLSSIPGITRPQPGRSLYSLWTEQAPILVHNQRDLTGDDNLKLGDYGKL
jgi:hypothetical protein